MYSEVFCLLYMVLVRQLLCKEAELLASTLCLLGGEACPSSVPKERIPQTDFRIVLLRKLGLAFSLSFGNTTGLGILLLELSSIGFFNL